MAETDAKTVARRWFEEVWNERRVDLIDELMAPDSIGHLEAGDVGGPDSFRQIHAAFVSAVPDLRIEIEDVVAEGDRAAVRWHVRGTHGGEGFGFAPTQQNVARRGTTWLRVRDGRIVEGWDTWNMGEFMAALRMAAR